MGVEVKLSGADLVLRDVVGDIVADVANDGGSATNPAEQGPLDWCIDEAWLCDPNGVKVRVLDEKEIEELEKDYRFIDDVTKAYKEHEANYDPTP